MYSVLIVHLVVGILVVASAALLVWQQRGRLLTLGLITLQVALGVWLLASHAYRAPSSHYALAIVGFLGLGAMHGVGAKPGRDRIVFIGTIISSALLIIAAYIGWQAAPMHPLVP